MKKEMRQNIATGGGSWEKHVKSEQAELRHVQGQEMKKHTTYPSTSTTQWKELILTTARDFKKATTH